MRKWKKYMTVALLALSAAALMSGCKGKHREKIDLSEHETTTAAAETMAPEESETTTEAETTQAETTAAAGTGTNRGVTTKLDTYSSGKVSIQYPSVANLGDAAMEKKVNEKLRANALSIIEAWKVDEAKDSFDIKCEVLSADRSRVTVIYTGTAMADGAAHPVNVFYSNTVDVRTGADLGLADFADPYTMAGYVLSDDCTFYNASADGQEVLKKAKNEWTLEQYTKLFSEADFPVAGSEGAQFSFPGTFSYEYEGDIYFSIPLPHVIGDYAIVVYTPDTK